MTKDLIEAWEQRSKKYKTSIKGVLQKSFPPPLNQYLHWWMLEKVKNGIAQDRNILALDLGCGYGRLSKPLLKKFPKLSIKGVDISSTYVTLYNNDLEPRGKAIKADIVKLPFKSSTFDMIFVVTTLMYLTIIKDQRKAMMEIFRVLKRGGNFVIIENNKSGYNLITLGGLISKKDKTNKTSVFFDKDYLLKLIEECGGRIKSTGGIPFWSMTLPLSLILCRINNWLGIKFLSVIWFLDKRLNSFLTLSLYISYTGIKR